MKNNGNRRKEKKSELNKTESKDIFVRTTVE